MQMQVEKTTPHLDHGVEEDVEGAQEKEQGVQMAARRQCCHWEQQQRKVEVAHST